MAIFSGLQGHDVTMNWYYLKSLEEYTIYIYWTQVLGSQLRSWQNPPDSILGQLFFLEGYAPHVVSFAVTENNMLTINTSPSPPLPQANIPT